MSRWSPARSFSPSIASGQLAHPLLVGAADHERALAVLEQLLEDHDLAGDLETAGEHDVERLVEHDLLAALEALDVDLGVHRDPHLAAGAEDVDGAVVVGAEEGAVGRRRHRELLDLFAQRGDVLARLAQGGGELLVLGDAPGRAGPWSRAAAPRACGPAWGRPGGGGAGRRSPPRAPSAAPGARRPAARTRRARRSCSAATSFAPFLGWFADTTPGLCGSRVDHPVTSCGRRRWIYPVTA